jgi:glycosyltransferase involved in cell wall biosynthesis
MRDAGSLGTAIATLLDDAAKRRRMGLAGRTWVMEQFEQRRVWELYAGAYRALAAT